MDRIQAHHLEDAVQLCGLCEELEKELPGAAVFVCSSDYEGMPNSLLEAMAMGLAVVSTDCPPGGCRMAIRDGQNGLLVPVGDAQAMADAICRLIEEPSYAEQIGRQARQIRQVAGTEEVFAQWREYLEEIVAGVKRENRVA